MGFLLSNSKENLTLKFINVYPLFTEKPSLFDVFYNCLFCLRFLFISHYFLICSRFMVLYLMVL